MHPNTLTHLTARAITADRRRRAARARHALSVRTGRWQRTTIRPRATHTHVTVTQ